MLTSSISSLASLGSNMEQSSGTPFSSSWKLTLTLSIRSAPFSNRRLRKCRAIDCGNAPGRESSLGQLCFDAF